MTSSADLAAQVAAQRGWGWRDACTLEGVRLGWWVLRCDGSSAEDGPPICLDDLDRLDEPAARDVLEAMADMAQRVADAARS